MTIEWDNRSLQAVDKLPRPKQLLQQPEGSHYCCFPGDAENELKARSTAYVHSSTHAKSRSDCCCHPYAAIQRGIVLTKEAQRYKRCLRLLHTFSQQPPALSQGQLCCRCCSYTIPASHCRSCSCALQLVAPTPGPSACSESVDIRVQPSASLTSGLVR